MADEDFHSQCATQGSHMPSKDQIEGHKQNITIISCMQSSLHKDVQSEAARECCKYTLSPNLEAWAGTAAQLMEYLTNMYEASG